MMQRYVARPQETRTTSYYAARYEPGRSLDDVRGVACMIDDDASLAEAPDLHVLVVRYLRVPDDHPARIDYEIVEAGDYLVYAEAYDLLYSSDPERFAREHEPAPAGA